MIRCRLSICRLAGAWLLGIPAAALPARADTIVPAVDRVDDLEARLTYARILSYRRETWADAAAAYERVLRDAPSHPAALTELAELRVRQGDLATAEQSLRAALQAKPGEPAATAALAQLFLWTNRASDAQRLFAATAGTRSLSADEKIICAQAFTQLGRHAEANRLLDELLSQTPTPAPELLSAAADAHLAASDTAGARELYRRALAGNPNLAGAQRGYALTLAWTGNDTDARPRLENLLQSRPDDSDVIHAIVRATDRLDGTAAAIARARARAEAEPRNAAWRTEWAELEAQRGYAVRSRQLFAEALALGATPELELRAGRAAITWGDFLTAERALRAALRRDPGDARSRDDLGRLLVSTDRNEQAEQFYEQWLLENPSAEPALLGLVRLRMKEKDFPSALVRCDALLTLRPGLPEALELKAAVLLAAHRAKEALEIFNQLDSQPGQHVDAELGLGRATREISGEKEAALHFSAAAAADPSRPAARFYAAGRDAVRRDEFLRALTGGVENDYHGAQPATSTPRLAPESAPRLAEWAGLFAEQGDFDRAVRCLQAARVTDPDYYPARAQLAEFLAIDAQFDAALAEFSALKKDMPGNRQVLLGEARALAWSRRYDDSLTAYAQLAALNPTDAVPRRKAARTAGWAKERDRGAALYATAWSEQPVDRSLATALRPLLEGISGSAIIERWRNWAETPAENAEPFAQTERFAAERFALRDALPESRRARLDQIYVDLLEPFRLQRAWWLENSAKQAAWDRRYASAESTFKRLLGAEPGNEEALFDLSQAQAAQGLGEREHATLAQLIELDANHSLASHALRRREIRSRPIAALDVRYWRERGRGDLSSLKRIVAAGEVQDTYADQMNVQLTSQLGRELPTTRSGRYAYRSVGLGADGVLTDWLSGSASMLHREFYDGRIGHADSGQAQLWAKHDSDGVGLGYEKREELGNEFALFQGTRSDNVWLGGTAAFTRKLDADARLTATHYSDDNHGVSFVVRPAYAWTDHPRIFKTILTLEYRDTDNASIYVRGPAKLADIIHPYWTPQNYTHVALTLEWYRDLASEFFVGSEEHYYDLRVTFGTDSESNAAATLEADWHREWIDRWIAHAGLYLNLSREWDALGLHLRLARRF